MYLTNRTETEYLKQILESFGDLPQLSEEALEKIHRFIFDTGPAPSGLDEVTLETLLYLKDLVQEEDICTAKELLDHYNVKEQELERFAFQIATNNVYLNYDNRYKAEETICFEPILPENYLTASRRDYRTYLSTDSDLRCYYKAFDSMIESFMDSLSQKRHTWLRWSFAYPEHICERYREHFPPQSCCKLKNWNLPEEYVYQFMQTNQVFILVSASVNSNNGKLLRRSFDCNHSKPDLGFYEPNKLRIKELFSGILTYLEKERPIRDATFKLNMIRLLLHSKLFGLNKKRSILSQTVQADPANFSDIGFFNLDEAAVLLYDHHFRQNRWHILRCAPGMYWITSDNPGYCISIDQQLDSDIFNYVQGEIRFNHKTDYILYFPISKSHCLRIKSFDRIGYPDSSDPLNDTSSEPVYFKQATEQETRMVNGLTARAKNDFVLSAKPLAARAS